VRIRRKNLAPGEALRWYRYDCDKRGAEVRDYVWMLSYEQYTNITSQPCSYCGLEPQRLSYPSKTLSSCLFTGIDRVDNNRGYWMDNVVPACFNCNQAKHTKTYDEFMAWIIRVFTFQRKRLE